MSNEFPQIIEGPKLVAARAEKTPGKREIKYVGIFDDGSERVIHTSPYRYLTALQLAARKLPKFYYVEIVPGEFTVKGEEFKFGRGSKVRLDAYLQQFVVATVQVSGPAKGI